MFVLLKSLAVDALGGRREFFGTLFEDLKDSLFECDVLDVRN